MSFCCLNNQPVSVIFVLYKGWISKLYSYTAMFPLSKSLLLIVITKSHWKQLLGFWFLVAQNTLPRLLPRTVFNMVNKIFIIHFLSHQVPVTIQTEETRVWQRKGSTWVCVHFHTSMNAEARSPFSERWCDQMTSPNKSAVLTTLQLKVSN